jgi:hypothetical protein
VQVIHQICCGIEVHAAQSMACRRRVSEGGRITTELVNCGNTYREPIAFRTANRDPGDELAGDQLADGMDAAAVLLMTSISSEA